MYQYKACYPVCAPVATDTDSGITYSTGKVLGEFMNANRQYQYAEANLYGDDKCVEHVKEITGVNVTLGVTWLPADAYATLFGVTNSETNARRTTSETGSPKVGVGWIKKGKRGDNVVYTVCWIYKAVFQLPDDAVQTKAGNIQFNTPSMSGSGEFTEKGYLDEEWDFTSLTDAKSKLDSLAGLNTQAPETTETTTTTETNTQTGSGEGGGN